MTEAAISSPLARLTDRSAPDLRGLARRLTQGATPRGAASGLYGVGAIALALGLLAILLFTIVAQGWPAFRAGLRQARHQLRSRR